MELPRLVFGLKLLEHFLTNRVLWAKGVVVLGQDPTAFEVNLRFLRFSHFQSDGILFRIQAGSATEPGLPVRRANGL